MRVYALILTLLLPCSLTLAQSGRKANEPRAVRTVDAPPKPILIGVPRQLLQRGIEKQQDYRCGKNGSHNRILDDEQETENVFSAKMVDKRVIFRSKPKPGYNLEARRNRKQGFVILKMALSASGKISRVRVLRGLPVGLTESAIKAACKMEFKPAMKDGQSVSQWVTAEYVFRLPDSRLFQP